MKELEEVGLTWGEAQAKAKDRVEWRRLISTLRPTRDGEVVWVSSGWSRGGVGGPPPLIFRPIWGPKGRNFFFWDRVSPLISRSGSTPPFLIWRSGSATGEWVSKPFPNGTQFSKPNVSPSPKPFPSWWVSWLYFGYLVSSLGQQLQFLGVLKSSNTK